MYVNTSNRERERERERERKRKREIVLKTENVCLQQCTFARPRKISVLLFRLSWLFPTNKQFKFGVQILDIVFNISVRAAV